MELFFVTHNEVKYKEAKQIGLEYNLKIDWINLEYEENQEDDIEKIALFSCNNLIKTNPEIKAKNFFLEDAGLFIEAFNGFPGPYSSYVFQKIGNKGILTLMKNRENRKARFKSVAALYYEGEISLHYGVTEGEIIYKEKGEEGFGFDPIFQPISSHLTFAEMSLKTKNLYSHRQKSLRELFISKTTFSKKSNTVK
ncbi:MAG: RdgB/HAM1 family non-canonical purine NTP pyrophosphatase [Candidatus Heimdallarchaeota archaeon]|nr:RdgB/HAM1 family non-canonical purine NTP pyrophosphatase [Candidatus Heimdallarchaeota archaeon]MCK4769398.1 RdgB/HAM1 family non-canonical purine NTP pyrophosphatase [Candidatus Heimdallarchaeota archaeon]